MKLTAFLLLAICLQVAARTEAQKTVTLSEKNASLKKVFNQLSKQTGISILYDEEDLKNARPVTLEVKDKPLNEVLELIFKNQPLDFTITDKAIVVKQKEKSGSEGKEEMVVPPIDIKGRIVNEKGEPVIASVQVKGTNKGTTTNDNGEFELKRVEEHAILVISGVSIETFEVKVMGRSELDLNAKIKTAVGEEVIINKGYYSVRQRENTGNVSKVSGEEIRKEPISDPILALEGRVAGLLINSGSGITGSNNSFQLRGRNSIANGNDPLFIVDGIPFPSNGMAVNQGGLPFLNLSPFNNLNPSDIESVEVLKDADATAIYGSRGANGVILITTRKGRAGKTKVDMDIYSGINKVAHMMHLLNTQQYLEMRNEAFKNDGEAPGSINTDYDLLVWDTTRYTDWQKVFIGGTGHVSNAQVSVSGGSENTQFLIGVGYNNTSTVFPGDFYDQKTSLHFNVNHSSNNQRFNVQFSSGYARDNNHLPLSDLTTNLKLAPNAPALYDANGDLNWEIQNGTSTWFNPFAQLLQKSNVFSTNLNSDLNLNYQIIPSLSLKANLGFSTMRLDQSIIFPLSSVPPEYSNLPTLRRNDIASNDLTTWIAEPQAHYNKRIGKGLLDVILGGTFQKNEQDAISQRATGFSTDALIENLASASTIKVLSFSNTVYKYNALFGRIGYNWKEKYLINLTARRDGSSRFGSGRQFGNFGSVGVGWIFSKENFIQTSQHFLSFGKIRASYGTTGNDQLQDYQYLSTYSSYSYNYQGLSGLIPSRIANPDFGWESVRKFEAGIELGFIQDRVLLNVSYYRNRTSNELVGYGLPQITGFTTVQKNLPAIVQNTGAEFEIHTFNLRSKNFLWTTFLNLTIPKNKLIDYPNLESSNYANSYVIGQPLSIQKLFHYLGVDPQTGVYLFQTKNTNGAPEYPTDLKGIKKIAVTFYGGFQNTLSYKSCQLDFLFQFVKQTGYNYLGWFGGPPGQFGGFNGADGNEPTAVLSRWQKPGDITNVEKFTQDYGSDAAQAYFNSFLTGDNAIGDASFIRLKNVSFSYKLSEALIQKMHLQNFRIYVQCQNLFTITNYVGLDPEVKAFALPPLRTIVGGVQITL